MNQDKGYIYIRNHISYDEYDVYKLGKAMNIIERDGVYATGEVQRGYFVSIYEIPIGKISIIERLLQNEFKKYHFYLNAGTELYRRKIVDLIDPYLKNLNLEYKKLSEIEIGQLERTIRKREFLKKIKPIKRELKFIPRNYQLDIIEKSMNHFKVNVKGLLVLMCGMGKTLISLWITKKLEANKILIGVPNKMLLSQWRKVIVELFDGYSFMTISSGVTQYDISEFIRKNEKFIVVTTFSSSHKIREVSDELKINFCVKILDEAHHLTTNNINFEKKEMKYVQMLKIPSVKQISLTATLKQLNEKVDGDEVVANDNIEHFGEIIEKKSLHWAIQNDVICDYVVQTIVTNEEMLDIQLDDLSITVDEDKRLLLSAFAAIKSIKGRHSHHLLIYANKQENSNKIIEYIEKILLINPVEGLYCNCYHSKMTQVEQMKTIEQFTKAKYAIISCVYCLGEGWDFPLLDGVVFAENMDSNIRIVQSALRASRRNKDELNKIAKIIIPVLYKDNWLEDNDNLDMKKIREIIYHIGLEDHTISEKMRVCRISIGEKPDPDEEPPHSDEFGEYDDELTRRLRLKTLLRGELKVTYEKARKILFDKKIVSIEEYITYCEKDARLPIDPIEKFGNKFNWIDYLNIDREKYYDLDTCRIKVKEYISKNPDVSKEHLNKVNVAKMLCKIDGKFIYYDLWKYFYGIELDEIIQLSVKKKISSTLVTNRQKN